MLTCNKDKYNLIKTNCVYFLDVVKTNSAGAGLILDKDVIFVVLSWIIMVAFPKHRA